MKHFRLLVMSAAALAASVASSGVAQVSGRPVLENGRYVLKGDDAAFQRLRLTATVSPSTATSTRAIQLTVAISNPTKQDSQFLSVDVAFAEIGVLMKTANGSEVKPVRPSKYNAFAFVKIYTVAPGASLAVTGNLADLGYELPPGTYRLVASRYSAANNVKPIYAAPITITILAS